MLLNPYTNKHVTEFIERKLIVRLRIFFFIIFILFDIIVLEISLGYINWWLAFSAILLGSISGLLFVCRKRIYWEEETSRVISRMDKLGIALLILYILFVIPRHWLLQHWLHDVQLTAFSLFL